MHSDTYRSVGRIPLHARVRSACRSQIRLRAIIQYWYAIKQAEQEMGLVSSMTGWRNLPKKMCCLDSFVTCRPKIFTFRYYYFVVMRITVLTEKTVWTQLSRSYWCHSFKENSRDERSNLRQLGPIANVCIDLRPGA